MKLNSIIRKAMYMSLLIELMTIKFAYCQFKIASITEVGIGVSVAARATGNDIFDDGSNLFEVSVWDDGATAPGFSYNVSGTFSGVIAFQNTSIFDPDVSLTIDQFGVVHALAGYYDINNSEWDLEVFDWGGTSFTSQGSPLVLGTGVSYTPGSSINIDADDGSNFVIVWNDGSNADLFAVVGDHTASTVNVFNLGTPVQNIGVSTKGYSPDVCIYDGGTIYDRVTYTYIDTNGDLFIDFDSFAALATGISTPTNVLFSSPSTGNQFYNPRIACPPSSIGTREDWTVVVEENDNSILYKIIGYNDNNTTVTGPTSYNLFPINLSPVLNLHPAVTYTNQTPPNVLVGWTMDNSSGFVTGLSGLQPPVANATYPIVVSCDDFGIPIFNEYWEEPVTVVNGDLLDNLSLSGRYGNDLLYSTFFFSNGTTINDIYTKTVNTISSSGGLKIHQESVIQNSLSDVNLKIKLWDITGKLLISQRGDKAQISNILESISSNNSNSLYIIEIEDSENHILRSKIFLNRD